MRAPVHFDNARSDALIICEREDFSDYMWMADEESFDKQVLAELQEEEEMEQCMEEMLAEEEARDTTYYVVGNDNGIIPTTAVIQSSLTPLPLDLWTQDEQQSATAAIISAASTSNSEILSLSQLNPEANEFVPSRSAHPVSVAAASSSPISIPPPPPVDSATTNSTSSKSSSPSKSGGVEAPDR